jgi:hypothetical protein
MRYQGLVASDELRAAVERRAARLERFHERVAACRIAVQRWYQHHGHGAPEDAQVTSATHDL